MFGGLTKTSSRIAIAAVLGLALGGFAFKATPARAADLGGDCCADLEERVAELEATTVRKGNKKVSVTLSGWVVKSFNYWDDGDLDSAIVGDKGYDLGSRFALTGSAQIAPGWSAGYNLTVLATGDLFADSGTLFASNQFQETNSILDGVGGFNPLYSYIYIKSDTLGTLNWGRLSPASDNPAVLADISGTVIETNGVFFEGASFFLRPKGGKGFAGLSTLTWADFLRCQGTALGIGVDCFGAAQAAIRYDSPTWGGFRFETSWGKQALTGVPSVVPGTVTPDQNFWDIAVFYTGDWNSIKVSVAGAYTWMENSVLYQNGGETDLWQVGGSIMHKPSGLGIYGMYQNEQTDGQNTTSIGLSAIELDSIGIGIPVFPAVNLNFGLNWVPGGQPSNTFNAPDTDAWYLKPFWRKAWSPIGATVLFGEYGQYNDQFVGGTNLCSSVSGTAGALGGFCAPTPLSATVLGAPPPGLGLTLNATTIPGDIYQGAFVTGSEVERWGLGVVQEIDSAAMHLWARWQHQEVDTDITGVRVTNPFACGLISEDVVPVACNVTETKIKQNWEDWDLFQVGGVIFF